LTVVDPRLWHTCGTTPGPTPTARSVASRIDMACAASGRWSSGSRRAADLPIFRTPVMCSYSTGTVLDLRWKTHVVMGGRRRTSANETEIETVPASRKLTPTHPPTHRAARLTITSASTSTPNTKCPTFHSLMDGPAVVGRWACSDLLVRSHCVRLCPDAT
jgi:hypothetical protein